MVEPASLSAVIAAPLLTSTHFACPLNIGRQLRRPIDPMPQIADLAREDCTHFHVDAAWGRVSVMELALPHPRPAALESLVKITETFFTKRNIFSEEFILMFTKETLFMAFMPIMLSLPGSLFAKAPSSGNSTTTAGSIDAMAANVATSSTPGLGASGTCSASVKSYGATGNGSSDDTAAIQTALNANAGGTVCFPSGVYQISQCLMIPNKTTLAGSGPVNGGWSSTNIYNSVLRLTSAGIAACMIRPADISNGNYQEFSLRELEFDGGAGNGGYVASGGAYIDVQNTFDLTSLEHILVQSYLNAPAIRIGPGSAGIGAGAASKLDAIWVNCNTDATTNGADGTHCNQPALVVDNTYGSSTGWIGGIIISNFEAQGTGTAPGVYIHSANANGAVRWISFQGLQVNNITGLNTPAVRIDGMENASFRDTFFAGLPCGGTGFLITNSPNNMPSANLKFDGVFNDGGVLTFINDQKHGYQTTSAVNTYWLQ
jgi:hypothetical protein